MISGLKDTELVASCSSCTIRETVLDYITIRVSLSDKTREFKSKDSQHISTQLDTYP